MEARFHRLLLGASSRGIKSAEAPGLTGASFRLCRTFREEPLPRPCLIIPHWFQRPLPNPCDHSRAGFSFARQTRRQAFWRSNGLARRYPRGDLNDDRLGPTGARVLRSGVMRFNLLNMKRKETRMHWSTPTLVEICIGLEINGYLPAEF